MPKRTHLLNRITDKTWCGKSLYGGGLNVRYSYHPKELHCGGCLRKLLDAIQAELDTLPTRNKKIIK